VTSSFDYEIASDFGIALLIGALLGIEREKRKMEAGNGVVGLRSFILLTLLGATGGFLGKDLALGWLLPAILLVVGAALVAGYFAEVRNDPASTGLTTEFAALTACLLGALATTGNRELAVGLGVLTAALLAYKQPLHGLVGKLGGDDVLVGMRFLLAAFIVLPLLRNRAIDPWGAINPYKLWLLVVLISGLSLVGYVATRWLGPGRGIAVTAATGGLASSTAVTLAFAKQSREPGADPRQLAGGIVIAWTIMFLRVLVTVTIVDAALLLPMLPAFVPMALCCAVFAFVLVRRAGKAKTDTPATPLRNPFSLTAAAKFAALFAVVQLLLKLGQQYLPQSGVYAIAALTGLTDVDAITVSMAESARGAAAADTAPAASGASTGAAAGAISAVVAVRAIAIACFANTIVKTGLAIGSGRGLARGVVPAAVGIVVAGTLGLLLG
jgi:uncharacterized membrane protein (DUF4010 family)